MTGGPFVAGVVLAAGRSVRFGGRSKLLLDWDGEPLVVRAVKTALRSRLRQVVVVTGHAAAEVARAVAGLGVETALNPAYADGQSTSVRAGLERVDPAARAAMFLPADQPFLTPHTVDRLIAGYAESERRIVLPTADEAGGRRRGAPVLWDRTLFAELADLQGDAGGRQILARHPADVLEVAVADALELADLDTEDDDRRLRERILARRPNVFRGSHV